MQDKHKIIGKIMASYPDMENITEEELQFLNGWLEKEGNKQFFDASVDTRLVDLKEFIEIEEIGEANRERYYAVLSKLKIKQRAAWWNRWQVYVIAASIMILVSVAAYTWLGNKTVVQPETAQIVPIPDINAGQFKATLTLDDGTLMILDSTAHGKFVQQGRTNVLTKKGQLVYQKNGREQKILYNRLTTGKGETYQVTLSDDTRVWLNAASSIRYPVSFHDDIRQVEVTGEVYFEVAPSIAMQSNGQKEKRPFVVNVNGMEVEVLGTHFNINSYGDEPTIKTTLLEGKVRVHTATGQAEAVLHPGEQAILRHGQEDRIVVNKDVDVDAEVAWRFGYFQFVNADLKTVMHQLERWYNVEVVYQGNVINDLELIGKMPRNMNLSQVLEVLQTQQVHFKLEGHTIIVLP